MIVLIKPQFEVSKKLVGKKGIIRDEKIHSNICENINCWFAENFSPDFAEIINSPVLGQKGNKEFLIYVKKN
jgi:23S rRNA (cytidine1920-2'-O)/16S rRNA (cytidine1409-2'-O)-methyltransferase